MDGFWVGDLDVVCEEFGVVERIAQIDRLRLQIRRRSHRACRLAPQLEVFEGWNHCSVLHRLGRQSGRALMLLQMVRVPRLVLSREE